MALLRPVTHFPGGSGPLASRHQHRAANQFDRSGPPEETLQKDGVESVPSLNRNPDEVRFAPNEVHVGPDRPAAPARARIDMDQVDGDRKLDWDAFWRGPHPSQSDASAQPRVCAGGSLARSHGRRPSVARRLHRGRSREMQLAYTDAALRVNGTPTMGLDGVRRHAACASTRRPPISSTPFSAPTASPRPTG